MARTSTVSNSHGISIRDAQPSDAAAIAHIGSTTFTISFGYSLPEADTKTYLENSYAVPVIAAELQDPRFRYFVACDDHTPDRTVVGFVQLTTGTSEPCTENLPSPIELQRLYVSPECHGKGVGKLLVQRAEEVARELGHQTLWLGVWEDNPAQKFYAKMGLAPIGSHDFVMGKTVQRDLIFSKAL